MATEFEKIIQIASVNAKTPREDDTFRAISGGQLITGVNPRFTELLQDSQTIRISSGGDNNFQTGSNQSERAQVPPATINKVPRVYGKVTTGGVIVDAYKTDANTLTYCMVVSEMDADRYDSFNQSATTFDPAFDVNAVYRDNDQCTFGVSANNNQVITLTDLGDSSTRDVSNANIRVWAYAGNSSSSSQIFPTTNYVNAYDVMPGWTSSNTMDGLVFVIVQMTQLIQEAPAQEVKIDQFGTWRFDISTNGKVDQDLASSTYRELNNPAWALHDYLTSDRYGVGLANADIDYGSIYDWANVCAESQYFAADYLVPGGTGATFPSPPGGTGYINTHNKFRIDAVINTQAPVATNIEQICAAGMATFNYNNKTGKFKVLTNRQMTLAEQAAAFHFTSDNMVGPINVSTTDIYSLFNYAEVTFPNYLQQDSADTIIVSTPTEDKLQNEPTTGTTFNLTTTTDRMRAADISNISLKQSRVTTVAQLTGDFSTMVVDVGDFVKVSDELKGWTEKFFRVMRITEVEQNGVVTCNFTLAEYQSKPYEEIIYYDTTNSPFATGFGEGRFWENDGILTYSSEYETFQYDPEDNIQPGLYIYDNPDSGLGNTCNVHTGSLSSVATTSAPTTVQGSPDVTTEPWLLIRTGTNVSGGEPRYSNVTVTATDQGGTTFTGDTVYWRHSAGQQTYRYTGFPCERFKRNTNLKLTWMHENNWTNFETSPSDSRIRIPAEESNTFTSVSFTVNDRTVDGADMTDTYGENSRISDSWPNATASGSATYILGTKKHDVVDHKKGEWTYAGSYGITYSTTSWSGTESISITPSANIIFVNTANIDSKTVTINAPGLSYSNAAELLANVSNITGATNTFSTTFNLEPGQYGLSDKWYASRINTNLYMKINSMVNAGQTSSTYTITNQGPLYR